MNDPDKRNPRLPRLLAVLIVSLAIFLILDGFDLLSPEGMVPGQSSEERIDRMQLILPVLFWPLLPLGLYVGYFGMRILRAGEFPPPGSKTLRPVEIIRGKPASVRGWVAILAGLSLCGLAVYGAVVIPGELARLF